MTRFDSLAQRTGANAYNAEAALCLLARAWIGRSIAAMQLFLPCRIVLRRVIAMCGRLTTRT
jgi:hypothetical protein